MNELVTPAELSARMGSTVDNAQASQALADASGLVRAISRQAISFVADDTIVLRGGECHLVLPQRPVVVDDEHALTVVELGSFGSGSRTVVEGVGFERIGNELVRCGVWAPRVQVTYSHGYQVIPSGIVAIVLDVAQILVSNPTGLRSTTIGSYSETYASETLGRDMTDIIRAKVQALGLRSGVGTMRLR